MLRQYLLSALLVLSLASLSTAQDTTSDTQKPSTRVNSDLSKSPNNMTNESQLTATLLNNIVLLSNDIKQELLELAKNLRKDEQAAEKSVKAYEDVSWMLSVSYNDLASLQNQYNNLETLHQAERDSADSLITQLSTTLVQTETANKNLREWNTRILAFAVVEAIIIAAIIVLPRLLSK